MSSEKVADGLRTEMVRPGVQVDRVSCWGIKVTRAINQLAILLLNKVFYGILKKVTPNKGQILVGFGENCPI